MSATASPIAPAPPHAHDRAGVKVWDLPLRLFHWLLVLAIAVAFLSAERDSPLNSWHIAAGWTAGLLILFRLVWGFVGGEHSRFADFVHPSQIIPHVRELVGRRLEPTLGHNPLGGLSVLVLLILVAATVLTGPFGGERIEDLHELIAWTLLAFVALHIAAVIAMSLLMRENLVKAMVVGTKRAELHKGAADARRPRALAMFATALVLAVTVYAILQYDPKAFTSRRTESLEQRGTSAAEVGDTD